MTAYCENKTELSIITPVYNAESLVGNAIDSVLRQSFRNYELILDDDGSTDGSGAVLDEACFSDERLITIHTPNGGVEIARDNALKLSSGEYLGFVDADDSIHRQMYEFLMKCINDKSADIAMCNYETVPDNHCYSSKSEIGDIEAHETGADELLKSMPLNSSWIVTLFLWNKVYRRAYLLKYIPDHLTEDEEINMRMLCHNPKVCYIDASLYSHSDNAGSVTRKGFSEWTYNNTIHYLNTQQYVYENKRDIFPIFAPVCCGSITEFKRLAEGTEYEGYQNEESIKKMRKQFERHWLLNTDNLIVTIRHMIIYRMNKSTHKKLRKFAKKVRKHAYKFKKRIRNIT